MSEITTIITTVGFPIAACVAMGWLYVSEIKAMTKAIQEMTIAVTKLSDKIEEA
nr:MAG TPA: YvrJ protein family protein [Microviridae sp.]